MKGGFQQIGGTFDIIIGSDGTRGRFTLEIDANEIVRKLASKAARNRSGVSRIISGAVVVRAVRS